MQLDTIDLPDDLFWRNEYQTNQVTQSIDRSLTGGLLIQEAANQYGQQIELVSDGAAWVKRSTVDALRALEAQTGKVMTLTLWDGTTHSVMFDRTNGTAVEAQQVLRFAYPDNDYWYEITLRLITVEPPA